MLSCNSHGRGPAARLSMGRKYTSTVTARVAGPKEPLRRHIAPCVRASHARSARQRRVVRAMDRPEDGQARFCFERVMARWLPMSEGELRVFMMSVGEDGSVDIRAIAALKSLEISYHIETFACSRTTFQDDCYQRIGFQWP